MHARLCQKGTIGLGALEKGKSVGKTFKGGSGSPTCRYFAWASHEQAGKVK